MDKVKNTTIIEELVKDLNNRAVVVIGDPPSVPIDTLLISTNAVIREALHPSTVIVRTEIQSLSLVKEFYKKLTEVGYA